MLVDMVDRLSATGVAARAAMAGTWGAAHALARYQRAPTLVVASEESGAAIAAFPVRALRLPDDMVAALGKVGIDSIIELESKPRAPLALRFGPLLTRRLDHAYGRQAEGNGDPAEGVLTCHGGDVKGCTPHVGWCWPAE